MFSISFFILSRRISSLKPSVSCIYLAKYLQLNGYHGYSRNYASHLFRKCIYSTNSDQFHFSNFNDFRITKRWKQTSVDQEKNSENVSQTVEEPPEKLSLFKRYHKMLKEYWYVLVPVHIVTSAFWFGGFYYAAKCGIDIVPFLEYINVPEKFIKPLRSSSLGYIAVASAFYKIATPARYMVTLGGTTFAIKFLTKRGLIKPVPTKDEMKTIIQNKLKKKTNEHQP